MKQNVLLIMWQSFIHSDQLRELGDLALKKENKRLPGTTAAGSLITF